MRATLLLALALLAAPLTGCITDRAIEQDPPTNDDPTDDPISSDPNDGEEGTRAASLAPGLGWTYNVDGAYAHTDQITITVALAGVNGYLFAAEDPDPLTASIAQNHPWHSWQTQDLNPHDTNAPLFDFPLTDGKTWAYENHTATAHATTLDTAFGPMDGYEITTDEDDTERTWTYARNTGYLVTYTETHDDTLLINLELESLDTANSAYWYNEHATLHTNEPGEPQTLTVPPNATHIILAAGGDPGTHTTILPPPSSLQEPWTATTNDEHRIHHETREATEGEWTLHATALPDAHIIASLTALEYIEIEPRYGSAT